MSRIARIASLVLLPLLTLHAQVDPRLGAFKTDFLDLLQRGNTLQVKPEILTLMDNSSSTGLLSFHKQFPNWESAEGLTWNLIKSLGIRVTVNADSSAASVSWFARSDGGITTDSKLNIALLNLASGVTKVDLPVGIGLVHPSGKLVDAAMAQAVATNYTADLNNLKRPGTGNSQWFWTDATLGKASAANWVRCASHARYKANYDGTERTIDIPLSWAILDKTDSQNLTAPVSPDYLACPVNRARMSDPRGGDTKQYEFDTTYLGTPNSSLNLYKPGDNDKVWNVGFGNGSIRADYLYWLFTAKDSTGNYIIPSVPDPASSAYASYKPFSNGIPALTRQQALKQAMIKTWFGYQDKVYWALRGLDNDNEYGLNPTGGDNTANATSVPSAANSNATGLNRTWYSMNHGAVDSSGNSTNGAKSEDRGVLTLSKLSSFGGGTPLSAGVCNSYAQIIDTQSANAKVFAKDGLESQYECSGSFLIVFTDGKATDQPSEIENPYASSPLPTNGNKLVLDDIAAGANKTKVGGRYYNMAALAGMAAQLSDKTLANYKAAPTSYPNNRAAITSWLPFAVVQRGSTIFNPPRPIETMTVGISLGDAYSASPWRGGTKYAITSSDAIESPKYALLAGAYYGDPVRSSYDLSQAVSWADVENPETNPHATSFFDSSDPDSLASNMALAFDAAIAKTNRTASSTPTIPFSGLGLGAQLYLASFIPEPKGPRWSGDLLMFPTMTKDGSIQILDKDGNIVGKDGTDTDLDRTKAVWSGGATLDSSSWYNRTVYTRIPGGTSLLSFNPAQSGNAFASTIAQYFATKKIDNTAVTYSLDQKKELARFLLGANTMLPDTERDKLANREKILGDIINSSISVLEYDPASLPAGTLSNLGGDFLKLTGTNKITGSRFRVIFVGTNAGFVHAFAEASFPTVKNVGEPDEIRMITGSVKELWSYIPTDFLAKLQFLKDSTEKHRNLCDGQAYAYHLDLPAKGQRQPDLIVNASTDSDNYERAVLIFGLGKGGRSYYALNVRNPFSPSLAWSIVPDEVETSSASDPFSGLMDPKAINTSDLKNLVMNMGFSTARPAVGRVLFPHPTTANAMQYRDVCFLSGGLSSTDMEDQFKRNNVAPAMGRSILAVDAFTGKYMAAYDALALASPTKTKTVMDCIPSGVIPFEFFVGSGLTQRLYFSDYRRGLWAIQSGTLNDKGSDGKTDSIYKDFRRDSSQMTDWVRSSTPYLRKVLSYPDKEYVSMLPAPFVVGTYPVPRASAPTITPAVAGIAVASGDKYNPVDFYYNSNTLPSHRLYMIFDRQDGPKEGISDTTGILQEKLFPVTTGTAASKLDPSNSAYFLRPQGSATATPYFGYKIEFPASYDPSPAISNIYKFVPKALNDPLVLVGTLFYSYFKPSANYDPCTGGSGTTQSFRLCNFFQPQFTEDGATLVDPAPTLGCGSGRVFAWSGLATQFVSRGTTGINQAGLITTGSGGGASTSVQIKTATTQQAQQWPRVRTWRSVYDY